VKSDCKSDSRLFDARHVLTTTDRLGNSPPLRLLRGDTVVPRHGGLRVEVGFERRVLDYSG
jgi:hypothetical protein